MEGKVEGAEERILKHQMWSIVRVYKGFNTFKKFNYV